MVNGIKFAGLKNGGSQFGPTRTCRLGPPGGDLWVEGGGRRSTWCWGCLRGVGVGPNALFGLDGLVGRYPPCEPVRTFRSGWEENSEVIQNI